MQTRTKLDNIFFLLMIIAGLLTHPFLTLALYFEVGMLMLVRVLILYRQKMPLTPLTSGSVLLLILLAPFMLYHAVIMVINAKLARLTRRS